MSTRLFALLLTALTLQAQTTTVYGIITNRARRPAIHLLVSIARKIAYTDDSGRYRIDGVPSGRQKMVISSQGKVFLETDVKLDGPQQRIDRQIP